MKTERAQRSKTSQLWYVITDRDDRIHRSTLLNLSESGGLFHVSERLDVGALIYVCPEMKSISGDVPDMAMIKANSNCVQAKVVRKDGKSSYGVFFLQDDGATSKKTVTADDYSAEFTEKGYDLYIKLSGAPSLQEALGFVSSLKNQVKSSLRLMIDFSDVDEFPLTALAILRDEIDKIMRTHRYVGLVNGEYYTKQYKYFQPHHSFLHQFSSSEEAETYLKENPITVSVVEDDPVTLAMVETFLSKHKLKVIASETAKAGLESIQEHSPNLILLDVHLPDMSGLETVRQIHQNPSISHTPIIMLTSDASEATVIEANSCNVQGYLLKPLDPLHFRRNLVQSLTKSMCLRHAG